MLSFWVYTIAAFGTLLFIFNMLWILLAWRQVNRLKVIMEYIATEYATKWFTIEQLTEQKFKRRDCENIVIRMLIFKILDSRECESKESNDFQEVVLTIVGNNVFLDSSKLKPFLDLSEFRYVGPPPPRRKRKSQKLNWDTLLPQGLKPAYS